jgi:hypothetical protein
MLIWVLIATVIMVFIGTLALFGNVFKSWKDGIRRQKEERKRIAAWER